MNDLFNDRPEGSDEAETSFIQDDNDLSDLPDLDDPEWRSFRNENANDSFSKRRTQINELSTLETTNDRKGEYVRRLLESEYRLNPNDGPISKDLFGRLDFKKYWISFDGVGIAYIGKSGEYTISTDKKSAIAVTEFKKLYEKARIEHRGKTESVVEE